MPTLIVVPNPTLPQMVRVQGKGFDKRVFVSLVFDGVGTTTKFKPQPDGTFNVGVDIPSTKLDGNYILQARKAGTTIILASTTITVKRVITPPPPIGLTPSGPIIVTSDNVVIENLDITVPAFVGTRGSGAIGPKGIYAKNVHNLTIKNCKIRGGDVGMLFEQVETFTIIGCDIADTDYAGILTYSAINGNILQNGIRRIANARANPSIGVDLNNAYGIALSRYASGDLLKDPRSSKIMVDSNIIEDVPLWHGLDTHQGNEITFSRNTVRRVARAIFITGGSDGIGGSVNTVLLQNQLLEAKTVPGGTNNTAITLAGAVGVIIDTNTISKSYDSNPPVYDYQNGSTGVIETGTILVP